MSTANAGLAPGVLNRLRRVGASVLPSFPPSTTDWRPLGVDVSHFNGVIDWGKLKAYDNPPVDFVVIRSGQGHPTAGASVSFYEDQQFLTNVYMATTLKIPWMQYHVFLPNYGDTERQVDYAIQRHEEAPSKPLALWWDHQLKNGIEPGRINSRLHNVMVVSEGRLASQMRLGIYSAQWVMDQYAPYCEWMDHYVFWWASWYTTKEKPSLPVGDIDPGMTLDQVKIHQTTSYGDGKLLGMESARVDLNRAMTPRDEFYEWLGVEVAPPPSNLEERVSALEEWRSAIGEVTTTN